MYCPKCGAENQNTLKQCGNCGFLFYPEEETKIEKIELPESVISKENILQPVTGEEVPVNIIIKTAISKEKTLGFILFGIAALVFLLSVIGAFSIFHGGSEIAEIQSVGGKTLEEAYYYRLQSVYNGYGLLVLTVGVFCSSVLSVLGCFCYWKKDSESQSKGV